MYKYSFKRHEKKYLIDRYQYNALMSMIGDKLVADEYGDSLIGNIYYDTPDYLLIRRSIEKPVYKEKLRLRCYTVPDDSTPSFIELKKKFKGVVYKRRLCCNYRNALDFLSGASPPFDGQITRELEYFLKLYNTLEPKAVGSYHRLSYRAADDPQLRITFDDDILFRFDDVDLRHGFYGEPIIDPLFRLMEIKTTDSFPLWLCSTLDTLNIYPTSFSKYGMAYKYSILLNK